MDTETVSFGLSHDYLSVGRIPTIEGATGAALTAPPTAQKEQGV